MPFIGHTLIYTCILIYIPTYPSATHDQTNILTSHAMFIVYLDGSRGSQGTFPLPEMVKNFGRIPTEMVLFHYFPLPITKPPQ